MTSIARDPVGRPARQPAADAPGLRVRTRRRETAQCVALSGALHLAALAAFAMVAPSGQSSGGTDGVMVVTFVGSDASLAALTEAWSPPEAAARPLPVDPTDSVAAPQPARADPPAQPTVASQPPVPPPENRTAAATDAGPAPRPRPPDLQRAQDAPPRAVARTTTRAGGTGGATEAGSQGTAAVSTGATQAQANARQVWGAQIQRALQRSLPTPRAMDRATRDMRIVLGLSVAPDGRLRGAKVLRSSGDAGLDAAALRSVRRMGRLPRGPAGLTDAAYDFQAPIDLKAP